MKVLFNLDEIGTLYYDRILFESYYPILFTAKNQKGQLFICVCCLSIGKKTKWLLTQTKAETLIDLLTNKITIREAFTISSFEKYSVMLDDGIYSTKKNTPDDWSEESLFLPTAGEKMNVEQGEFEEEIQCFCAI